jgi:CRISPR-associated endonuclease Csn1
MRKKILGLDLGVSSIGWALINESEQPNQSAILDMGCRIIPLTKDDKEEFVTGKAISKNQKRTTQRTQRKGYNRYQLRRYTLSELLKKNGMMPDEQLIKLSSLELYGLRDKALKDDPITPQELGRIFYHLNQKRGYKSSRSEENSDKKDTEYVAEVKSRHATIKALGLTIGQYFFSQLQTNKYYTIKQQVFPREAYIEEFDAICGAQQKHHPNLLTPALIDAIRNDIIYMQRPLKSQKGLVSVCEFEGKMVTDEGGKSFLAGPKVAPKSSPIAQLCKNWELVNNIVLKVKNPDGSKYKWRDYQLTIEEKQAIANHLNIQDKLSYAELLKILGLKKENVFANKQIQRDLKGNTTYSAIAAIVNNKNLLQFNWQIADLPEKGFLIDKKTGEVLAETNRQVIDGSIEKEPFYQLWHTIYAIKDMDECKKALIKKFNVPEEEAEKLARLDFNKAAFGEKSTRMMRKILPYLMKGHNYADACSYAGYNHSNSITNEEREKLETADHLELLAKNSLRQPVVEKILNQMINLINALIQKHGKPDEIRVELARELKQSKDERNEADFQNNLNKKIHDEIEKRLTELNLPATRKMIQKYKFIFPTYDKKWKEAKVVNQCIYCGETFNLTEALAGDNFDVDHIVPKALLFDDSQTNKVLVHRKCNGDKTNTTAYDYIAAKGEQALAAYVERVDGWFKSGIISYGKMQRLKVSYNEYVERKKLKKETEADKKLWENFIDRQLRETAYIAKKARQLLYKICTNVHTSEGTVTARLRRIWGWDEVLMNLQLPKYRELGLTEMRATTSDHGRRKHEYEVIPTWTKRDDHRHHAIDALVVACTKQGFIQRMNTLNASEVRDEMKKEVDEAGNVYAERLTLLENFLADKRPFTTKQVENEASKILISFKAGKKVATISKRKALGKNADTGVITPRGALSEETVYGKIKALEKEKPVKYLFENPDLIFKPYIKALVGERLAAHDGETKKAIASLKKEPIYLDEQKTIPLTHASCYKEEVVVKYSLAGIKRKDVPFIVDKGIRELVSNRLQEHNDKEKEAFKNPLYSDKEQKMQVKTVRCFTGLQAVEAVKKNEKGEPIGFVKPGNNHHIAIYADAAGEKHVHGCSFWHAVERKKHKLPVVIENSANVWERILNADTEPDQIFLDKLPTDGWVLQQSFQQNEMFVMGLEKATIEKAIAENKIDLLGQHLYRVQKISCDNKGTIDIWLRHHLETELIDTNESKMAKRFLRISSIAGLENAKLFQVTVNNIGEIKVKK